MLVRLDHKVHVLFRRQDIDMVKLEGKVAVVLDVLFATTTMVTAPALRSARPASRTPTWP